MLITKSTKITNSSPEVFSSFPKSEKIFNSTPFKHNLKSVKTKINPENFEITKSNSKYTTESKLINYWYLERIKEFQKIKLSVKSWEKDFDCPNIKAIYWADYILDILRVLDIRFRKVIPSVSGGIALCFMDGKRYADIECFNDGSILAVKNLGYGKPHVWTVHQDDCSIKKSIIEIQEFFES